MIRVTFSINTHDVQEDNIVTIFCDSIGVDKDEILIISGSDCIGSVRRSNGLIVHAEEFTGE